MCSHVSEHTHRHLRKGKCCQEEGKQKRDLTGLISRMFTACQIISNVDCVHPGEVMKHSDLSARLGIMSLGFMHFSYVLALYRWTLLSSCVKCR